MYQAANEVTGEIKNRKSWQVVVKQFDLKASNNKKPLDTEVQEEENEKPINNVEVTYEDENGNVIPIPQQAIAPQIQDIKF